METAHSSRFLPRSTSRTHRGPPFDGGAVLDRARPRFAGSFQLRPNRPAIRLASPSVIRRDSAFLKNDPFAGLSPLPDSNRGPPPYHVLQTAIDRNRRQRFCLFSPFAGYSDLPPLVTGLQPRGPIKAPSLVVFQDNKLGVAGLTGVTRLRPSNDSASRSGHSRSNRALTLASGRAGCSTGAAECARVAAWRR